ncbi:thioredoxin-disulfide reductase [Lactobacillus helveticus]|uniref:Thioredoxin reductase n=2 Tax=Lactobacillus helveticus TaxID=1587 RepID=A0A386RCT2_LACHE|nr:thioredoxin reductase [Lactobacillus helveticus CNRZ32]AJY61054.1 thioredoxin reductase [Lactobacillus helveticus]EEW67083.1 thioredoxin-disulfide reductase [Lactobacillus helveticus DSM 20075 = CGMCC 1.1877]CDI60336.1 Thioredoxin reductase [Lactobacillus helveticus CIRM-BIA 104]CDI62720.1 Thioredoxin reductase [Lactobacillus helveticus CIRM-BIA 103]CDI65959.1 Thioredoxin reductase [Lactobacillus helveticus CIRM-BIA 101]
MKEYDLVVIGAGPGGMTAAMYGARANLKVAMIDRGVYGGQMNNTAEVENYPGFPSIMGPDLGEKMYKSATKQGVEFVYGDVQKIELDGQKRIVKMDPEDITAKAVIIATGSTNRKLGIPGEEEYSGRGVSYCAVCDGAFFKDENVAVVGGGDSAISEGLYLANLAKDVDVIHRRDQLRAERVLQTRAFKNPKMEFTWDSVPVEIVGDENKVTGVKVHNKKTDEDKVIDASGVFIYIGNVPNSEPFKELKITDDQGWIITNDQMETTVPGIYAVGDVRQKKLRQIVTAVGDGGIAGQNAFEYISELTD